jgi:hypothetical protein
MSFETAKMRWEYNLPHTSLNSQFLRAGTSKPQLFTSPTSKNTRHQPPPQQYAPHLDEKHKQRANHSHKGYSDMLLCAYSIP